jgi:hypothetical protein
MKYVDEITRPLEIFHSEEISEVLRFYRNSMNLIRLEYYKWLLERKLSGDKILTGFMMISRFVLRIVAHYADLYNSKFLNRIAIEKNYLPWGDSEKFEFPKSTGNNHFNFSKYFDFLYDIPSGRIEEIYYYGEDGSIEGFVYEKYESFHDLV